MPSRVLFGSREEFLQFIFEANSFSRWRIRSKSKPLRLLFFRVINLHYGNREVLCRMLSLPPGNEFDSFVFLRQGVQIFFVVAFNQVPDFWMVLCGADSNEMPSLYKPLIQKLSLPGEDFSISIFACLVSGCFLKPLLTIRFSF